MRSTDPSWCHFHDPSLIHASVFFPVALSTYRAHFPCPISLQLSPIYIDQLAYRMSLVGASKAAASHVVVTEMVDCNGKLPAFVLPKTPIFAFLSQP
ncbi:unnamed protein product [Protopolystoma xenopodis]|uniref:Uncharacterized protein n=1 Tax=Protopolystoma xenopodis TaxID=117903 RepID=A0A3S5BT27_9PLAT|nr:unnamed protein product [Protopolystoma xenopodis]